MARRDHLPRLTPPLPRVRTTGYLGAVRVHVTSLGCRLNEAEAAAWGRALAARGHELVDGARDADAAVINTCAVTHDAARTSRRQLAALADRVGCVVVTGCWATLEPARAAVGDHVIVVANRDKEGVVDLLEARLGPAVAPASAPAGPGLTGHTRAFVKVQDGCRHRCTFCVTTVARGDERSRPAADVVSEIRTLVAAGFREVVLTGVHLAGWGERGATLGDLLDAVLADTDLARLRLSSLEPWGLGLDLWRRWRDRRLLPHLHLPAQSGSDRVLRRMARRARAGDVERLVAEARAAIAGLAVTTDLIAGFPGETDDDHAATLALVARAGFAGAHVFPFSPRPGTRAAALPDPVPPAVAARRAAEIRTLAAAQRGDRMRALVGAERRVLWERPEPLAARRLRYHGYSDDYLPCTVDTDAGTSLWNRITHVRIDRVDGDRLVATLAPSALAEPAMAAGGAAPPPRRRLPLAG